MAYLLRNLNISLITLTLFSSFASYAVENDNVVISCSDATTPAAQLKYRGKELDEEQAAALSYRMNDHGANSLINPDLIDISYLDPKESDIWIPPYSISLPQSTGPATAFPNEGETVSFEASSDSRSFYRGVVKGTSSRLYLNVALTSQETLLTHALLEKLHYKVEPMKWYSRLKIQFKGRQELLDFKRDVADKVLVGQGSPAENAKLWIVEENLTDYTLLLKDVILEPARVNDIRYAWGEIDKDRIGKNRAARALITLYSLVNLNSFLGSFNRFSWEATQKFNEGLLFLYPVAGRFANQTDCDDIRWITRKIAVLSLRDWQELSEIPKFTRPEFNQLLLYKLLARRNNLIERVATVYGKEIDWTPVAVPAFISETEDEAFSSNPAEFVIPTNLDSTDAAIQSLKKVTFIPAFDSTSKAKVIDRLYTPIATINVGNKSKPLIKRGEINPAYKLDDCCSMAIVKDEQKNPLRFDQVKHLITNEVINAALGECVPKLNSLLTFGDVAKQALERATDYEISQGERLKDYVYEHGTQDGFPFQVKPWAVFSGNIFIQCNREITTGSFYGSKAKSQLVDTIAIGVAAGGLGGVFGRDKLAPVLGNVGVSLTHVFTHVRPIEDLASLKDENRFKTSFEPIVFKHIRKLLGLNLKNRSKLPDPAAPTGIGPSDSEVQAYLNDFLSSFKDGEVLTISDGFGGKIGAQGTFNLGTVLGPWAAALNPSLTVGANVEQTFSHQITFNRDSSTLQVYDSKLNPRKATVTAGLGITPKFLKAGFNVAQGSIAAKRGTMDTDAIAVDLSPIQPDVNQQLNSTPEQRLALLRSLQTVFTENDATEMKEGNILIPLHHELKGRAVNLSLLGFVKGKYREGHKVEVVFPASPDQPQKSVADRTVSLFSHRVTTINGFDPYGLFGKIANSTFGTSSIGPRGENQNPSGTFLGSSHIHGVQVDADITQRPPNDLLTPEQNEPFIRVGFINESYSGTKISGEKLIRILERFNDKYKGLNLGRPIFTADNFKSVKGDQAYDIRSRVILYNSAMKDIENLFGRDQPVLLRKSTLKSLAENDDSTLLETDEYTWLDEAITLGQRSQKTGLGKFISKIGDFLHLTNFIYRNATNDLEREQMQHVEWLTRALEFIDKHLDISKFLDFLGPQEHTVAILVNGKRLGVEDGAEGILLNPSGTQNADRLPFGDVKFDFNTLNRDGKPNSFSLGGNAFEPSVFLGGF